VQVLQKPNGGKYSALNHGLAHASGEIIVTVDADSLLETDVLKQVAATFQQDETVGAVAGNLSVINRGSFITEIQELEYLIGIQLFRRAYDVTRTVAVIPGAFGAYRRDVLDRVGQFDGDTLTEDRDATIKILKTKCGTRAIDGLCQTEAPETWKGLYRQRLRWYRGTVQTLLKHRDVLRTPSLGFLYSLVFPMEIFAILLVPIAGVVILGTIIVELLSGSVIEVIMFFSVFTLLQLFVTGLGVQTSGNDMRLIFYAPFFVIGYRQFLDFVMLKSVFDVFLKRDTKWTSPDRTGDLYSLLKDK
jgi:biofilm PGA synthesis N-glycosyltransferase PgaC